MLTVYDPAVAQKLTIKNCIRLKRPATARAARPSPWEVTAPRRPQGILTSPKRLADSMDFGTRTSVEQPAPSPARPTGTRQAFPKAKTSHLSPGGCVDTTSKLVTPPGPDTVTRRFPRPKTAPEKGPRTKAVVRPWGTEAYGLDRDQLDDLRVAVVKRSNDHRSEEFAKTKVGQRQTCGIRAPKPDVKKALRQPYGTQLNPEMNLPLRKWCRCYDTRQLLHWRSEKAA